MKHVRLGTTGYETSVENEDVLARLATNEGWGSVPNTKTLLFLPKADCVVTINGFTSTVTEGATLIIKEDEVGGGYVSSFITVTADVEFVLSASF